MALIDKTSIGTGNTIQAEHITRIIDALNESGSYEIIATGSFTGSFTGDGSGLTGITVTSAPSATSASYATTASYAQYAVSASYEINYETSSSYSDFAKTASYVNATNIDGTVALATTASYALSVNWSGLPAEYGVAVSDETTDLTTGTAKLTFRMPFAMTLTSIRANVTTAPSGSDILVGVNTSGGSIINDAIAPLRIDSEETTSVTATNQPQITTSTLNDDERLIIDIDQVGSITAGTGLKVTLIGYRT
tara:strand:- start:332 stop:1084 length:753 start_codon:yes stop_codon:yes gene_type:complete